MNGNSTMAVDSMGMMGPFGFIFSKSGHSSWLSLPMLVPVVNLVTLYFLAFSNWPALKK